VSTNSTADDVLNLLVQLVVEWVPADEYGPDDAAVAELPAGALREARRRFRRDAEGQLRRVVAGVPVIVVSTCLYVEGDAGCGECANCVGERADEVVLHFWDGHEDMEVVTQLAPVEFSQAEALTYTALRSKGLSIADARAMTGAILA
jgi:hypothetical protein